MSSERESASSRRAVEVSLSEQRSFPSSLSQSELFSASLLDAAHSSFSHGLREDSPYWDYPAPIAAAIVELLEETVLNSADELIHLLEVWLRHLGWLWLCEYLHVQKQDKALDLQLFQTVVENRRDLSVGAWAYLGSTISRLFAREGWTPFVRPLKAFDYGDPQDANSSLSRLLRYRNSFAHGSFSAMVQDILSHRTLLWELIEAVDGFRAYPIVFWDAQEACWRCANGRWSAYSEALSLPQEDRSCYILSPEGASLALWPGIQIEAHRRDDKSTFWAMGYLSIKDASREERSELLSRSALVYEHLQEYNLARQGVLDFQEEWEEDPGSQLEEAEKTRVMEQLNEAFATERENRPSFALLLGYPGSGKSNFFVELASLFPEFDGVFSYRIQGAGVTSSALTCARYFIRQLAQWLEEPHWLEDLEEEHNPAERFNALLQELGKQNKRVLLGIDQFHEAYEPYRNEPTRIYDLLVSLKGISSQHVCFLLSARPGYRDDLLRDALVELPIAELEQEGKYASLLAEQGLASDGSGQLPSAEISYRRMLLWLLSGEESTMTVFDVRDQMDSYAQRFPSMLDADALFTPRIERTLWDLRPLLRWGHFRSGTQRGEKFFAPFCRNFAHWCRSQLGPVS